mmetsp:Transcript_80126/g.215268  ORF Transcript_80126/g.215268 Transcript_80126/m.215268 type:complete len:227 (+) Transcript_80126:95-775(+)
MRGGPAGRSLRRRGAERGAARHRRLRPHHDSQLHARRGALHLSTRRSGGCGRSVRDLPVCRERVVPEVLPHRDRCRDADRGEDTDHERVVWPGARAHDQGGRDPRCHPRRGGLVQHHRIPRRDHGAGRSLPGRRPPDTAARDVRRPRRRHRGVLPSEVALSVVRDDHGCLQQDDVRRRWPVGWVLGAAAAHVQQDRRFHGRRGARADQGQAALPPPRRRPRGSDHG